MENKNTPVNPNKMFFYVFLRVALSYFKSFYKKEQEEFKTAEQKRIDETENLKLKRSLIENFKKGLRTMAGGHSRFLDVSDNLLRHAVNKADTSGQDYFERVTVGIKMIVERVNNVQDFPRIAQMIDIYNTGALNDIFDKKQEQITDENLEVMAREHYPEDTPLHIDMRKTWIERYKNNQSKTAVVSEDDKELFGPEKSKFERAIEKTAEEDPEYKKFVEKEIIKDAGLDSYVESLNKSADNSKGD